MVVHDINTSVAQLHDLNPEYPDSQFHAAIALGKFLPESLESVARVVDELIIALSPSHQALTRAHAAETLGILKDARAVVPLVAALKDDYRLVRSYAARSLRQIGDPAAIDPLVDCLRYDDFFGAKAEAAEALGVLCQGNNSTSANIAREVLQEYREAEQKKQKTEAERNKQGFIESKRLLAALDNSLKDLNVIIGDLKYAFLTRNYELARQKIEALEHELQQAQATTQHRPDDYIRAPI